MAKKNQKVTFHFESEPNQRSIASRAMFEHIQAQIVALDNERFAGTMSERERVERMNVLLSKYFGRKTA